MAACVLGLLAGTLSPAVRSQPDQPAPLEDPMRPSGLPAPAEAGTYTILCAAREQGVTFTAHIGLSSTDLRPTAPTGFVSTENPDGSKTLTWIDTSNNEDSFVIWKRDENDNWEELGSVAANETTATITPQGTLAP